MEKNPKLVSWMNIPDLNFENLVSVFWVKILKFFDADPKRDLRQPWIRDEKIGSGILDKYPGTATLYR
jgi:hypothetical protein